MRLTLAPFVALAALAAACPAAAGPTGKEQVVGLRGASSSSVEPKALPGVRPLAKSASSPRDSSPIDVLTTGSIRPLLDTPSRAELGRDGLALRGSIGMQFFYSQADSERLRRLTASTLVPRAHDDGLRGAIESAVYSSYGLRATLHDVRAMEKTVWRELMRFTPVVNGEVTANVAGSSFNDLDLTSPAGTRYAGLSLTMPLLTGGERYFSFKAARSAALSAGYSAAAERDGVVLDTVNAYLQHVYANRAAELYGRDEARLLKLLAAMKAQHAGGFASGADVAEIQAELAGRRQLLVEAQAQASKAQEQVNGMAGRPVSIRSAFPQMERELAAGYDRLLARAMKRNARVMAAAHNAESSSYISKAAYSRYLPRVDLSGEYRRYEELVAQSNDKDRWSVGLRLAVPLVDLSTAADISASKERAAAERFRALDTRRLVRTQFANMWDDYQSTRTSRQLAVDKVSAQNKVAAASLARYEQGVTTLRNVLEDQRALTAADLDELQLNIRLTYTICQVLLTADAFNTAMLAR